MRSLFVVAVLVGVSSSTWAKDPTEKNETVSRAKVMDAVCPSTADIGEATGQKWIQVKVDPDNKRHAICQYTSKSQTAIILAGEGGTWDLQVSGDQVKLRDEGYTGNGPAVIRFDPKAPETAPKTVTAEMSASSAKCHVKEVAACLEKNGKDCLGCAAGLGSALALGNPIPAAFASKDCLLCGYHVGVCLFKTFFRSKCK